MGSILGGPSIKGNYHIAHAVLLDVHVIKNIVLLCFIPVAVSVTIPSMVTILHMPLPSLLFLFIAIPVAGFGIQRTGAHVEFSNCCGRAVLPDLYLG